jgi:UDP-N-acetylmuramate dehydrogenase
MNAGTHLGEAKDALRAVEVIPLSGEDAGTRKRFTGPELQYQYRKNLYLPEGCVVWQAEWEVRAEEPALVKSKIDETLARRKSTQPIDYPSCGSVFKNPKASGMSAWQVVDKIGLRGYRVGDAQFAEKHSNFIINLDRARAADVRALIELAKSKAQDQLGIALEEEVMYVGRF